MILALFKNIKYSICPSTEQCIDKIKIVKRSEMQTTTDLQENTLRIYEACELIKYLPWAHFSKRKG